MKLILTVFLFLLTFFIACKKSNYQPNMAPPVTDTIKIPVVKVDTSTLLKSLLGYTYDATGTTITDSSLEEWKYDDQRRILQQSLKVGTLRDTVYYTYSGNGYTMDDHTYTNGSPTGMTHTIYYQHLPNRTDSAIANSGTSYYYYYNQLGLDSLIKQIIGAGTPNPTIVVINYYYTGQNLDSTNLWLNGNLNSVSYYVNGDPVGSNAYGLDPNNSLISTSQITYTDYPSDGLRIYIGSSKLLSSVTNTDISNHSTSVSTYTYQFDTVNRVSVWIANNNQPFFQKYFVSWY